MTNEVLDGTDVMRQLLREREGLTHETRHALSQGIVEAFDVIGFPGVLRDGAMLLRWDDPFIDRILVRMEHCPFTIA